MQVELRDADLGIVDMGCDPYVVVNMQIGSPDIRAVSRTRALTDGTFDETRFLGARAVTLQLRLRNREPGCRPVDGDMQQLLDRVVPFMHPARRPLLIYRLPGALATRLMIVRGQGWPFTFEGPHFPVWGLQFVCPTGEIYDGSNGGEPICVTITPSSDVEVGRHYGDPDGAKPEDRYGPYYTNSSGEWGRQYAPGLPLGARQITNPGTSTADWTATIFGPTTMPSLDINGVVMSFDRAGGVDLAEGETLVIDTRERTILLNGDPAASRYDKANFTEWTWAQLRLRPGRNLVRFDAVELSDTSSVQFCYRPVYLA